MGPAGIEPAIFTALKRFSRYLTVVKTLCESDVLPFDYGPVITISCDFFLLVRLAFLSFERKKKKEKVVRLTIRLRGPKKKSYSATKPFSLFSFPFKACAVLYEENRMVYSYAWLVSAASAGCPAVSCDGVLTVDSGAGWTGT